MANIAIILRFDNKIGVFLIESWFGLLFMEFGLLFIVYGLWKTVVRLGERAEVRGQR